MRKKVVYATGDLRDQFILKYEKQLKKAQIKLDHFNQKYNELSKKNKESRFYINRLLAIGHKIEHYTTKVNRISMELYRLNNNTYERLSPFGRFKKWFKQIPYEKQKSIWGVIFAVPWIIGIVIFFFWPITSTLWWSFNTVRPAGEGLNIKFAGFSNYKSIFDNYTVEGRIFLEVMTNSTMLLLTNLPIILIFSLFIAVLLNTKFKGHQLVKAIFFIPVIYNAKVIEVTMTGQFGSFLSGQMGQNSMLSDQFSTFLYQVGIADNLVSILVEAVSRIFSIVNMSGIQILIFIAALQSIPGHLYEAAKVEGATKYESFWKITFPMVSSMFLPVIVYTIIDTFATSPIMRFILISSSNLEYGISSAIATLFFLVNAAIIVLIFVVLRKAVFYYDE